MFESVDIVSHAYAADSSAAFAKAISPILTEIVYPIVYVVFSLAVFLFIYGVLEMVIKGSPEARSQGRLHILFGVIGMFIMVSAWGIIYFISSTLQDVSTATSSSPPGQQPIQPVK